MSSTREVCCLSDDFEEALLKALIFADFSFPIRSVCFPLAPRQKLPFLESAGLMQSLGD